MHLLLSETIQVSAIVVASKVRVDMLQGDM
jgi:hypothetical protein